MKRHIDQIKIMIAIAILTMLTGCIFPSIEIGPKVQVDEESETLIFSNVNAQK